MTKYSICKASGESLGTFEAPDAASALVAWGRTCGYRPEASLDLIATAVGLPAAPAASACPLNLPLTVGTQHGRVSDQIFDAKGQAVLILYGVDSRGSLEEARTMTWNQNGLARADYVVKAVNEHEGLVARLKVARARIDATPHGENCFLTREGEFSRCCCGKDSLIDYLDGDIQNLIHDNLASALEMGGTLIAKPVDRRKD